MNTQKKNKGRFIKGIRCSPSTEFKKGQHWRKPQKFREKQWLIQEYIVKKKTASDIAGEFKVHPMAITYWLRKHKILRRNTTETRKIKYWGQSGEKNPMFNRRGSKHPNWHGGLTPFRQKMYKTLEAKKWFKEIYKRDGKQCKNCGYNKNLQVHHILPVRDYPLLILDINNGIVLCKKCHDKTKCKETRYAKKFFNLLKETNDRGGNDNLSPVGF